jgi:hypothetical protein
VFINWLIKKAEAMHAELIIARKKKKWGECWKDK